MRKAAIERVEGEHLTAEWPDFHIGDMVEVGVTIVEGEKERVQVFAGRVIARKGKGAAETFTVRRDSVGAERTFPIHSPSLAFIRVVTSHRVRRAKLYFMRKRVGKATRLVERSREVGTVTYRDEAAAAEAEAEAAEGGEAEAVEGEGAEQAKE
jgi:large subunit ribosomal protein L19